MPVPSPATLVGRDTVDTLTNKTYLGDVSGCTGFPTATYAYGGLGANVPTGAIGNWASGPTTGAIGASGQVWLIMATANLSATSIDNLAAQIWNGSSAISSGPLTVPLANAAVTTHMTSIATLSGPTTFTLQAQDVSSTGGRINAQSHIAAVRLA